MGDQVSESGKSRAASAVLAPRHREEIQKHLKGVMSADFSVRAASIGGLQKFGAEAAEAVVDSLMRRSEEPHALTNFSDALAEIGRPSIDAVIHALSHIREIRREADVYLVEQFVDLIVQHRDRRGVSALVDQLGKLDAALGRALSPQLQGCCEAAKVRLHRALVSFGEKGGVESLLRMLGDGRRRVRDGVVELLARVGDRRALVPLVRLYDIEEHVSSSGAQAVKEAFREIARRERAASEDKEFRDLAPGERAILDRLLGKVASVRH
jgi:HEAT repeat protein